MDQESGVHLDLTKVDDLAVHLMILHWSNPLDCTEEHLSAFQLSLRCKAISISVLHVQLFLLMHLWWTPAYYTTCDNTIAHEGTGTYTGIVSNTVHLGFNLCICWFCVFIVRRRQNMWILGWYRIITNSWESLNLEHPFSFTVNFRVREGGCPGAQQSNICWLELLRWQRRQLYLHSCTLPADCTAMYLCSSFCISTMLYLDVLGCCRRLSCSTKHKKGFLTWYVIQCQWYGSLWRLLWQFVWLWFHIKVGSG